MLMSHFADPYCDVVNETLHHLLQSTWVYRQEVYEVGNLATALLVTYDDVREDVREYKLGATWEQFLTRMARVKADWANLSQDGMSRWADHPEKTILGWEGRTIYFIKGGAKPEFWSKQRATNDLQVLLLGSALWGEVVELELAQAPNSIPVGREHFADYERMVRVAFTFLFREHLSNGRSQVRTEPDDDGLEIRDIVFTNCSERGYWKDLKDKYACSEVVIDAKNTSQITRGDLRQLCCYLKPAIGLWGFIVCRTPQPEVMHAYNRTLFKNFTQTRGLLILSDEDLRRMVAIARRGHDASEYLRERMSEFVRGI